MKTCSFTRAVSGVMLATAAWGAAAQAVPSLSFYSYAQTYGYVSASYTSSLLGTTNFQLNMPNSYTQYQPPWWGTPGGVATMDYHIQPGQGGQDPIYDIVTSNGLYGFNAVGLAQVDGLRLRGQMTVSTLDA